MTIKLARQFKIQISLLVLGLIVGLALTSGKAQAACPALDTSRGTVTNTFNVPAAGTYTIWARMATENTANDSFTFELDGTTCGITVGDTALPATPAGAANKNWKWVDYKSGNTATKNTVTLTAGTHTYNMIGREDGVMVDRIMLLTGCTPAATGNGNDCVSSNDTQAPTGVAITAPANNATLAGTVNVTATATDNVGVTKVEFYLGNTLIGTDTASPYALSLNTAGYADGSYQLTALAYDAQGYSTRSSVVTVTIQNGPPPDTIDPVVSITAPLNGSTVSGPITVSANATDNSGTVTKVEFLVDGILKQTLTAAPYNITLDTTTLTQASHTITAKAYDPSARVGSASVTVTVTAVTPAPKKCDFNNDNKVDVLDLGLLIANYKTNVTAGTKGDCNTDGKVDIFDLGTLISVYGK